MKLLAKSLVLIFFPFVLFAQQGPPPPQGKGPYFHQVMSASSKDGITFTLDNILIADHASVPAAIVTKEGTIRVYFVDATTPPEKINAVESRDGGKTYQPLPFKINGMLTNKGVDPSIVTLPDGRYRLYYFGFNDRIEDGVHGIYSAISNDGITFTTEAKVFEREGLVDPDVFWDGKQWLMYVCGRGTLIAKSSDGLKFEYVGEMNPPGYGTTAPVRLPDGSFRLYAFKQPDALIFNSFVSPNAIDWKMEDGIRLQGPPQKQITDPFVVQLPDGTWKMIFKTSDPSERQPQEPVHKAEKI